MADLNSLAPLVCVAPMGVMFWMMNRNRAPRAEQNNPADAARARSEELTSLQNEVARLREETRLSADDNARPRNP